jgi:predicted dehydrogenase
MRYALVGAGARHVMFRRAITETYAATDEQVGLCDCNGAVGRSGEGASRRRDRHLRCRRALAKQQPDAVIVAVPDYRHHE